MTTRNLSLPELTQTQSSKFETHNRALHIIDSIMGGVIDRNLLTPPALVNGNAYLMPATGTLLSDWSGFANDDLVYAFNDGWANITPSEGWYIYVQDEDLYLTFDGTDWQTAFRLFETVTIDSSTARTLSIADHKQKIMFTNGAAVTITLPEDATETLPAGFTCELIREGAGTNTLAVEGTDTLNTVAGNTGIAQHGHVTVLLEDGADPHTWKAWGDLV